jgi:hypothetical protein
VAVVVVTVREREGFADDLVTVVIARVWPVETVARHDHHS